MQSAGSRERLCLKESTAQDPHEAAARLQGLNRAVVHYPWEAFQICLCCKGTAHFTESAPIPNFQPCLGACLRSVSLEGEPETGIGVQVISCGRALGRARGEREAE